MNPTTCQWVTVGAPINCVLVMSCKLSILAELQRHNVLLFHAATYLNHDFTCIVYGTTLDHETRPGTMLDRTMLGRRSHGSACCIIIALACFQRPACLPYTHTGVLVVSDTEQRVIATNLVVQCVAL